MTAALIYLAILVVAFFLLIVLPQRRRMSAHRALVDAMAVGDEIVTTAGIHGIVREMGEATLELEIAPGVVVTLARGAVSSRRRPDATPEVTLDVQEAEALDDDTAETRPPTPRSAD
jgi:preprotein translocase subunit YajC